MIPTENKQEVVRSGIAFMRSITEAFGTDVGLELWDTIATTLDPDVKGSIFFAMLTGEDSDSITIHSLTGNGSNKIELIKAIRAATGAGLKEAKDKADLLIPVVGWNHITGTQAPYTVGRPITLKLIPGVNRNETVANLRRVGCVI